MFFYHRTQKFLIVIIYRKSVMQSRMDPDPRLPELLVKSIEHILASDEAFVESIDFRGEKVYTPYVAHLTECCLYLKLRDSPGIWEKQSLFDLQRVWKEEKGEKGEESWWFAEMWGKGRTRCIIASVLVQAIYEAYYRLNWGRDVRHLAATCDMAPMALAGQRPANVLALRYVAAAITMDQTVNEDVVKWAEGSQMENGKFVEIKGMNLMGAADSLMYALSMEINLRTIVLDNTSGAILGVLLNWAMTQDTRATNLILRNYTEGDFSGMSAVRDVHNLVSLTLEHCSCEFVAEFLKQVDGLEYSIDEFVLNDIQMTDAVGLEYLRKLESAVFFKDLKSMGFVNFESGLPLLSLLKNALVFTKELRQLVVENCGVDIFMLISALEAPIKLSALNLRRNYGATPPKMEGVVPMSITRLDLGDCKWEVPTIKAFFTGLFEQERELPLILSLDHASLPQGIKWLEVFSELQLETFLPVLSELNFGYNVLDGNEFEALLRLLGSQITMTTAPKGLRYLGLSGCFGNQDEDCIQACLHILCDFCASGNLWGLELRNIFNEETHRYMSGLIKAAACAKDLVSLDISDNVMDAQSRREFLKFLHTSQSIAEICVDRIGSRDSGDVISFYDHVVKSHSVLAMKRPIYDLQPLDLDAVNHINIGLYHKRAIAGIDQRLALYMSAAKRRELRTVSTYSGTAALYGESLLMDESFVNPIGSLLDSRVRAVVSHPLVDEISMEMMSSGEVQNGCPLSPPAAPRESSSSGSASIVPTIFSTIDDKPASSSCIERFSTYEQLALRDRYVCEILEGSVSCVDEMEDDDTVRPDSEAEARRLAELEPASVILAARFRERRKAKGPVERSGLLWIPVTDS